MTKTQANPKIDAFLRRAASWRKEMEKLREIILHFPLAEELKWSKPAYAFEGRNVLIIIPFKASCALMFCQGALLKDAKGILSKPGENTQAGRWVKFTSIDEVAKMGPVLKSYIREAIEVEKAGLRVKYKRPAELKIPDELERKFGESPALETAFAGLTPGRRRAYVMHFSAAKQSATRLARIEKYAPQILKGRGMNDDYRLRASRRK